MMLKILLVHAMLVLVVAPVLCSAELPIHIERCEEEHCEHSEGHLGHDPCDFNIARRPSSSRLQGVSPVTAPVLADWSACGTAASGDLRPPETPVPPGSKLPCPPSDLPQLA